MCVKYRSFVLLVASFSLAPCSEHTLVGISIPIVVVVAFFRFGCFFVC